MAESKRPNYRTKGAVLIMVLTIMFVLIIMLIATLSVVANAKKRTYTSFEETQANLTARSAVEFFVKDLSNNNDKDISGSVDPYYTTATEMTYARQIEMDIRTLTALDTDKSVSGTGATEDWYNDWLDDPSTATIPAGCDPTNFSYDDNDPDALYKEDFATALDSPYDTYSTDTMLKYEVTLPKAEKDANKYGKFADSDQKVIVTVEVLDRYYNKGTNAGGDISVKYGDRAKDYVKLRVTATAVFDDYESTTVIIVEPTNPPTVLRNDFTKGVVATGPIKNDTKIYALGGLAANANYSFTDNKIYDSLYVNGNLDIGSSGDLNLGPDCYIVATGNIDYKASQALVSKTNKSFIYAGGKFNMSVSGTIGNSSMPLDIICNGGNITAGTIYGDIYCRGSLTLGNINVHGNIYVYGDPVAGVIGNLDVANSTIYGDVYVNGNIYMSGNKVNGDGSYSAGSAALPQSERINGDIHCNPLSIYNGTLLSRSTTQITGVTAIPYTDTYDLSYFASGSAPAAKDDITNYLGSSTNKTVNDAKKRTITLALPGKQYGTPDDKKYELPSFEYEYPVYLSVSENPATGTTTGYKLDGYVSAVAKYQTDIKNTTATLNDYASTQATYASGKITSSGYLPSGDYDGYIISTGVTLQLVNNATYTGNMFAENDTADINIIVPDNAKITLKCGIFSDDLAKVLKKGSYSATYKNNKIYSGYQPDADKGNKCSSPRINMYVGDGATITLDETSTTTQPMLNAYVYGPNANLVINAKGEAYNMNYNGTNLPSHGCIAVGAMVFNDIKNNSEPAIVFVPQGTSSSGSHTHGHSFINWGVNHYTNDKEYGNT